MLLLSTSSSAFHQNKLWRGLSQKSDSESDKNSTEGHLTVEGKGRGGCYWKLRKEAISERRCWKLRVFTMLLTDFSSSVFSWKMRNGHLPHDTWKQWLDHCSGCFKRWGFVCNASAQQQLRLHIFFCLVFMDAFAASKERRLLLRMKQECRSTVFTG